MSIRRGYTDSNGRRMVKLTASAFVSESEWHSILKIAKKVVSY